MTERDEYPPEEPDEILAGYDVAGYDLVGHELERIDIPAHSQEGTRELLSGLARLAAGMWLRSAGWGLGASLRLIQAAGDPRAANQLAHEIGEEVRSYAREFLGVADLEQRLRQMMPAPASRESGRASDGRTAPIDALRAHGAELLRRSADVERDDTSHPAYARILEELAPDEARMLRLLSTEGAQPAVDIRAVHLIGFASQVVAEGLNMIGQEAGCRHPERVHSYLNNLNRLGLIWFSKEPIEDPVRYQVLEAQPDVLGAIKGQTRVRTVQRSIGLTPFGRDFCEACFPLDDSSGPERTQGPRSPGP